MSTLGNFVSSRVGYKTASDLNTAMAGVYKNMSIAVLVSMFVSWAVSTSPDMMAVLFGTPLKWVVMFAPLVAVFAIGFTLHKLSKSVAYMLLFGFAALMGLSMSTIFVVYTGTSIFTAFMGAAVLFGVMSLYGYFTKKDLDSFGKWLFVGLIAIVIASIINLFVGSSVAQMVISAIAIVIFMGLTAYDTQTIRDQLYNDEGGNVEVAGALSLYLNFINLFMSLLQLFGNKND